MWDVHESKASKRALYYVRVGGLIKQCCLIWEGSCHLINISRVKSRSQSDRYYETEHYFRESYNKYYWMIGILLLFNTLDKSAGPFATFELN